MSPILLGVSCALTLLTLGSMAILYWMVLRPMRQTIQGTAELLRDLANSLSPAVVALGNQLDGVPQQLLPLLRNAQQTYETGVFLPDDQQAANLERQMLASEDRMIRTTGGQPFSPLHSSSSDSRSRRGSSSRAARNSGNR